MCKYAIANYISDNKAFGIIFFKEVQTISVTFKLHWFFSML